MFQNEINECNLFICSPPTTYTHFYIKPYSFNNLNDDGSDTEYLNIMMMTNNLYYIFL